MKENGEIFTFIPYRIDYHDKVVQMSIYFDLTGAILRHQKYVKFEQNAMEDDAMVNLYKELWHFYGMLRCVHRVNLFSLLSWKLVGGGGGGPHSIEYWFFGNNFFLDSPLCVFVCFAWNSLLGIWSTSLLHAFSQSNHNRWSKEKIKANNWWVCCKEIARTRNMGKVMFYFLCLYLGGGGGSVPL